jgi:hypothetical protein
MAQLEYVKIANDGNSKQIWFNKPYDVDGNRFKTRTIFGGEVSNEYYTVLEYTKLQRINLIKANQKMTFYVRCEEHDAEIIILPYYMGNSFENVVKVVDADKLI